MADQDVPGRGEPGASITRRPQPGAPRRPSPGVLAIRPNPAMLRAAPNVARVAAVSALHLVGWTVGAAAAGANYVVQRSVEGQPPTAILQEAAGDLRNFALRALGIDPGSLPNMTLGAPGAAGPSADRGASRGGMSTRELQRRGIELLRRSNDVNVVEDTHPAFARILTEITPDEARILRFIYLEGPQPALDIRTFRPLGIGSELVAAGMSMIGEHAGLRNLDRIDQYLTNLSRLGLVDFSREPVSNPNRYQVIEAQPKTIAAMKSAGRAPKLVQRSIRLTSFGEEFVRTCLPLNGKVVPTRAPRPLPDATL
jgi:Abortive infection alpha